MVGVSDKAAPVQALPKKRKEWRVAVGGLLLCALAAIGAGAVAGGKVALGVLALAYVGWTIATWLISRHGSDQATLWLVLARPFFMGGWLVALASVIVLSRTSLDWVVILPLGLAWLGLGIFLFRIHTRSVDRNETAGR